MNSSSLSQFVAIAAEVKVVMKPEEKTLANLIFAADLEIDPDYALLRKELIAMMKKENELNVHPDIATVKDACNMLWAHEQKLFPPNTKEIDVEYEIFHSALECIKKKDFAKASEHLNILVSSNFLNPHYLIYRAVSKYKLGQLEAASEDLVMVEWLARNPNETDDKAKIIFEKAQLEWAKCLVYLAKGEWDKSKVHFKTVTSFLLNLKKANRKELYALSDAQQADITNCPSKMFNVFLSENFRNHSRRVYVQIVNLMETVYDKELAFHKKFGIWEKSYAPLKQVEDDKPKPKTKKKNKKSKLAVTPLKKSADPTDLEAHHKAMKDAANTVAPKGDGLAVYAEERALALARKAKKAEKETEDRRKKKRRKKATKLALGSPDADKIDSNKAAEGGGISDKVVSDETVSDKTASDKIISGEAVADKVASDKVVSDEPVSDGASLDKVTSTTDAKNMPPVATLTPQQVHPMTTHDIAAALRQLTTGAKLTRTPKPQSTSQPTPQPALALTEKKDVAPTLPKITPLQGWVHVARPKDPLAALFKVRKISKKAPYAPDNLAEKKPPLHPVDAASQSAPSIYISLPSLTAEGIWLLNQRHPNSAMGCGGQIRDLVIRHECKTDRIIISNDGDLRFKGSREDCISAFSGKYPVEPSKQENVSHLFVPGKPIQILHEPFPQDICDITINGFAAEVISFDEKTGKNSCRIYSLIGQQAWDDVRSKTIRLAKYFDADTPCVLSINDFRIMLRTVYFSTWLSKFGFRLDVSVLTAMKRVFNNFHLNKHVTHSALCQINATLKKLFIESSPKDAVQNFQILFSDSYGRSPISELYPHFYRCLKGDKALYENFVEFIPEFLCSLPKHQRTLEALYALMTVITFEYEKVSTSPHKYSRLFRPCQGKIDELLGCAVRTWRSFRPFEKRESDANAAMPERDRNLKPTTQVTAQTLFGATADVHVIDKSKINGSASTLPPKSHGAGHR